MPERYGRVAMALHWAIALLALFQIGLGWWMIDIPKSPAGLRAGWFIIVVVVLLFSAIVVLRHRHTAVAQWAVAGVALFVALQLPLLVHEIVTGFPNVQAASTLATSGVGDLTVQVSPPRRIYEVFSIGLVGTFGAANIEVVAAIMSLAIVAGLGATREKAKRLPAVLVGLLLLATVAQAVVLYRGPIFEHYYVPIAPILYLGFAAALAVSAQTRLGQMVAGLGVAALVALNLLSSPLRLPPENQVAHTQAVAQLLAVAAGAEPFELWLLAGGESDGAYRFWLERMGRPPAPLDGPVPPQLFIICRIPICDPARAQDEAGQEWASARVTLQSTVADDEIIRLVNDR